MFGVRSLLIAEKALLLLSGRRMS